MAHMGKRWWAKLLGLTTGLLVLLGLCLISRGHRTVQFTQTYYAIDLTSYYSGYSSEPVKGTVRGCRHESGPSRFICRYDVQWRRWIIRGGCYIRTGHGLHCWVVIPENLWLRG